MGWGRAFHEAQDVALVAAVARGDTYFSLWRPGTAVWRTTVAFTLTAFLVGGVFALDLLTRPGWTVLLLYLVPLYLVSRVLPPWWTVLLAVLCIALGILGYVPSLRNQGRIPIGFDRLVGAAVLCLVSLLFLRTTRGEALLRDANERLAHDIAEREQAERSLRASETRHRHIVNHANDIIYRTDAQGHFIFINPMATRLMKYSETELLGRHHLELIREDHRAAAELFYRRQLVERIPSTYYECPAVAKDGEEYWFGQNVQLVMDGNRVVGFQAIVRDITKRKRLEEERQQLVALVQHSDDFIGLTTLDGRVLFINEAGRRLVGLCAMEDVGRTVFTDYFLLQHRAHVRDQILPVVMREGRWGGEIPLRHFKTTEVIPAHWNVFLITDSETKEPKALACVSHDLRQRKRVEASLRDREREVQRLLEERQRLSEDLHDNIIQLLYATGMQLEECRYLTRQRARQVRPHLDAAIRALNTVIQDVRNYLVADLPQALTGDELIGALKDLASIIVEPDSFHLRFEADPGAAHHLTPEQAKHLLCIAREGVSNILRHASARKATLRLDLVDGAVRLILEDDGVGFDIDGELDRGHGLTNMRRRAAKVGAQLETTSRRGSGTRIVLLIPRTTA